jgi:hypothetical protein
MLLAHDVAMGRIHTRRKMKSDSRCPGPVVIGGVGGSGTRVIASILQKVDFYVGRDLNRALDNLWFVLLFKHPKWFAKNSRRDGADILRGLQVFERAMTGRLAPHLNEFAFIMRAAFAMALTGHTPRGQGRGLWPLRRVLSILSSRKAIPSEAVGWGWKEPNSHIYIEYLSAYFGQMKYIHVMRHGLDMAYSTNQQQLYNWGPILFGIQIPTSPDLLPKASLNYWIKANERAVALGEHLLADRFFMLRYDDLCQRPQKEVKSLIKFLEIDHANADLSELCSLITIPKSMERYKKHNLSIFSREEIDAVQRLGFAVEDTGRLA